MLRLMIKCNLIVIYLKYTCIKYKTKNNVVEYFSIDMFDSFSLTLRQFNKLYNLSINISLLTVHIIIYN